MGIVNSPVAKSVIVVEVLIVVINHVRQCVGFGLAHFSMRFVVIILIYIFNHHKHNEQIL